MTDPFPGWSTPDAPAAPPAAAVLTAAPRDPRRLIPLRPLGVGELLDGSVAVIRARPRALLAFGVVLAVLSAGLDLIVMLSLLGPLSVDQATLRDDPQAARDALSAGAVNGLLGLLVSTFLEAVMLTVITRVLSHVLLGEPTSLRQTWAELRPRAAAILGVALLVAAGSIGVFGLGLGVLVLLSGSGGGAFLGFLAVVAGAVFGVLVYVRWAFAPAVLVLEGQRPVAALRRSWSLAKGTYWRILGVLLLAVLISFVVSIVLRVPFSLLGYSPFSGFDSTYTLTARDAVLGSIASALALTLTLPFTAGVRALLYLDRRIRTEALDVALRLR